MSEKKIFSTNWNAHNLPIWETHLSHLRDKPTAYLEIGVWEGRNICWLMDNLLVHPDSTVMGIDAWDKMREPGDPAVIEARAYANVKEYGDRVQLIKGTSASVLSRIWMKRDTAPLQFDLCFVDGSHEPLDILVDSALVWRLMRPGGVVIWDEFRRRSPGRLAIEHFLAFIPDEWEEAFRDRKNLGVRKKQPG